MPLRPAFCHIIELMATSASTSVAWNHRQWNFVLSPESGSQDASGDYCRAWLPELSRLPTKHLHQPWRAPADVLAQAGVRLGVSYPHRIVSDLPAARRATVRALLATRAAALEFNDPG